MNITNFPFVNDTPELDIPAIVLRCHEMAQNLRVILDTINNRLQTIVDGSLSNAMRTQPEQQALIVYYKKIKKIVDQLETVSS